MWYICHGFFQWSWSAIISKSNVLHCQLTRWKYHWYTGSLFCTTERRWIWNSPRGQRRVFSWNDIFLTMVAFHTIHINVHHSKHIDSYNVSMLCAFVWYVSIQNLWVQHISILSIHGNENERMCLFMTAGNKPSFADWASVWARPYSDLLGTNKIAWTEKRHSFRRRWNMVQLTVNKIHQTLFCAIAERAQSFVGQ